MLHITYLIKGLFGLAAISSFAGFVFHLLSGNPDLALMCFVGIGGSAAMVWMFTTWRQRSPSGRTVHTVPALARHGDSET
jgi:hypothetical protein